MKIVNREEFLKLPKNTVYCFYMSTGIFSDLHVKESEGSFDTDWVYSHLFGDIDTEDSGDFVEKIQKYEKGEEFKFDLNVTQRDAMFEKKQLFAVYNKDDILSLLERLKQLI